ncbi:MAG: 30S ribosomal protein S2 [Bacteroidales bacterium]|nr:30S ribosomal protein S2 [Bacteroidales bacterium]MBN2698679.1 30S ribosomal protein S2 [Bacteroidales bacterium]
MPKTSFEELLEAGVHFGHLKRKWNPAMAPYIFMEKNGIHIIDLKKTQAMLEEASSALKQIAKSGRKILFVATKKQAKEIVAERISKINMPYVTERWPGGMLTNFPTIRKAVKKMAAIDKMAVDGTFDTLSKRERLQITRQRAKLEKNLGSIADLTRLPAAMFIVDITKEYIAVREANRLNIPVFAMVDTNSDPRNIDFPIPANDDASKSISLIIDYIASDIEEGLKERKMEREKEASEAKEKKAKKETREEDEEEAPEEKERGKRTRTRDKVKVEDASKAKEAGLSDERPVAKNKPSDVAGEETGEDVDEEEVTDEEAGDNPVDATAEDK